MEAWVLMDQENVRRDGVNDRLDRMIALPRGRKR
jgi:hypothetical protein